MNPIYTGKDVSYIDTKQSQLGRRERHRKPSRLVVFAALLTGAEYPQAATRLPRRCNWPGGAHHDAITARSPDQVYLDLLTAA